LRGWTELIYAIYGRTSAPNAQHLRKKHLA